MTLLCPQQHLTTSFVFHKSVKDIFPCLLICLFLVCCPLAIKAGLMNSRYTVHYLHNCMHQYEPVKCNECLSYNISTTSFVSLYFKTVLVGKCTFALYLKCCCIILIIQLCIQFLPNDLPASVTPLGEHLSLLHSVCLSADMFI